MDQDYKKAHKKAESIRNQIRDVIDDHQHTDAARLMQQAQELMTCLQNKQNPRTAEDRINQLIKHLEEMRREGDEVMDYSDIDSLRKKFEELQHKIKGFDNY